MTILQNEDEEIHEEQHSEDNTISRVEYLDGEYKIKCFKFF